MLSPAQVPLPSSPSITASRRSSSSTPYHPSPLSSPYTVFRPRLDRNSTSITVKQEPTESDPFREGSIISVNQPVGSISISPNSRDVCLASRKGLYILDLVNLNNAPRFIPQGGTWQIADVQWSPHPSTSNLILSTSSQKLLVWDLGSQKSLRKSIDAHSRAITDINWHALNPNLMATVSMDAGIRGWDLRKWNKPFMRLCAWDSACTQIKWNRKHENLLATASSNLVQIWDNRKGSIPLTTITAHSSKIYGIDWDRRDRDKLVTCSLDKTIKFWSIPELRSSSSVIDSDPFATVETPDKPTSTITTSYPVWRARNLPFGRGILSLPQRGEQALELYGPDDDEPVERFEGHDNVVKDFVWRVRGGDDSSFDDRDFQLITWGKDRTLRIWPIEKLTMEKVGFRYGGPIEVTVSRRGAPADITYTVDPLEIEDALKLPPPLINPSNLSRQKPTPTNKIVEAGMTRGGGGSNKIKGMDQLEWLTKVVKTAPSPDTSTIPSRVGSISRAPSRNRGQSVEGRADWISLKDELVLLNKLFPRPKINFEKIDLVQRRLTMSMQGPWANGDRMAFIRIHWSFPPNYPYGPETPTFELERNPTVSPITRQVIVRSVQERRAINRQCLISTTGYLLGSHERVGRRLIEEESDSESEKGVESSRLGNVPMLIRTCGATFGPNGQLVCFFPKQVILPRTRLTSRSPSISRDVDPSPMLKAIAALAKLQNPHKRGTIRYKPRLRKLETIPPQQQQIQAGSTMTIHDVNYLSQPHAGLAKVYNNSIENNLSHALEAKKLDHAEVWSTLRGVLMDPPPAYSALPPVRSRINDIRRERYDWERSNIRKKKVVDQMFSVLIAERNFQLLALVSCILLDYEKTRYIPPPADTIITHSPEQDYFTLPKFSHSHITPTRQRTIGGGGSLPHSPTNYNYTSNSSGFRNSAWSQMLNPSAISLRSALTTPKERSSFSDLPFSRTQSQTQTPGSYEDFNSPNNTGIFIPSTSHGSNKKIESPRFNKDQSQTQNRPKFGQSISASASPPIITPLKSSGTERSFSVTGGNGPLTNESKSHNKVSFGSASPLGKANITVTRAGTAPPPSIGHSTTGYNTPAIGSHYIQTPSGSAVILNKRSVKSCAIKLDFPKDETPPISLLSEEMKPLCEIWKLTYADFLLRMNLLEVRAVLMNYEFVPSRELAIGKAAIGIQDKNDGPPHLDDMHSTTQVCVSCSSDIHGNCPSCSKPPKKAMCSFCRLPIKGLSMGCSICAHKLHSKCFQRYFLSPVTTPMTCPACVCSCLSHKGISTPYYTITTNIKPSPAITKGFARGSITPVSPPSISNTNNHSPEHGGGGVRNRVTYASLAKLGSIREGLGISTNNLISYPSYPTAPPISTAGPAGGASTFSSGSVLGLNPDSSSEDVNKDGKDQNTNQGLLARARWGDGGLLHWKGHN